MIEILALILVCLVISVIWLGHQISRLTDRLDAIPRRVPYDGLEMDHVLVQRGETPFDAAQRILREAGRAHRLLEPRLKEDVRCLK